MSHSCRAWTLSALGVCLGGDGWMRPWLALGCQPPKLKLLSHLSKSSTARFFPREGPRPCKTELVRELHVHFLETTAV